MDPVVYVMLEAGCSWVSLSQDGPQIKLVGIDIELHVEATGTASLSIRHECRQLQKPLVGIYFCPPLLYKQPDATA